MKQTLTMTNHFNEILPFHFVKERPQIINPFPVHSEELFFNRLSLQPTMTPSLSPVLPGFHLTQTVLYNEYSKTNVDVLLEAISPPPLFSLLSRMPGVDLDDQTEGNSGQLVGGFLHSLSH